MADALEHAIEKLRAMAPEQQKFVADYLDGLADASETPVEIGTDDQMIVDRALAEIDAGDIATDEEVAAYRRRAR